MENETKNPRQAWCDQVATESSIDWEHLPELKLYMDQVLTLMERELSVASANGTNPITSSMINNYVKDGVVPRPEKKKYGREHIAMLYMVCMMKSALPLPQIHQLLTALTARQPIEELYGRFSAQQTTELRAVANLVRAAENDRDKLCQLAMELALEANARHLAAMQILRSLEQEDQEKEALAEQEKKAEKKAEKEAEKPEKAKKKAAKKAAEDEVEA